MTPPQNATAASATPARSGRGHEPAVADEPSAAREERTATDRGPVTGQTNTGSAGRYGFFARMVEPFLSRWRNSLKLRTMTITALITGGMIFISGTFILTSVSDDLFSSRREQVLEDSARATRAAQQLIDASDASDRVALAGLVNVMRSTIRDTSSSQMFRFQRSSGQPAASEAPLSFSTNTDLTAAISPDLTAAVVRGEHPQYWQSVSMPGTDGQRSPAIIVGSNLTFPSSVGTYELYIGYSLADTANTYAFIQRTLLISAGLLMLLIGILVWTVSRVVFRPIRVAAETSRSLAAGHTEVRMPKQNDEQFDVLSDSFNDMADTLQSRISELDELSTVQQRFVSDVSHELRTPLTTIRLAGEVLYAKKDDFDPTSQRTVELLHTQVARFEQLLGDLLEISRYDAGQVQLEAEPTNIARLTEEACAGLQPLSDSEIRVRAVGGYVTVDVDPRRIRRIITNLVGNAIEHGEGRPIIVTIDSNANAVGITVRDSGIGMTAEHAARVFDRFWRADPSRKRTLGGSGLGLAIAQEDAEVHGGALEAWSRPGFGTNMRLTLPRRGGTQVLVSPLPLVPDDAPPGSEPPARRSVSRVVRKLRKRGES